MNMVCPKCFSDDISDITDKYSKKDAKTSGAVIGTLFFPLIGTLIGSTIAEMTAGEDKDAYGNTIRRYECNECHKKFQVCPKCRKLLKIDYFDSLPERNGYEVVSGKRCRRCKHIIRNPEYRKTEENNT